MKRGIYHVIWRGETWHIRRPRARRSSRCHDNKRLAIEDAKYLSLMANRWQSGQVVIHGKNGRIQTEWTYGGDPRRSRG